MKYSFMMTVGSMSLLLACSDSNPSLLPAEEQPTDQTRRLLAQQTDCPSPPASDDYREYQHGIDFVRKDAQTYYLIWGSSGNPPTGANSQGNWTHDVYYSTIDVNNPQVNPQTLISRSEAQEPPSSAAGPNGNIFITMEDGFNVRNSIAQRYAVFTNTMQAVKPYPNMVYDGGHSGHVAAVGNRFVVFWSDDWNDDVPGADGIGTGLDVLADVFDAQGNFLQRKNVATGTQRDWWPVVAGSASTACMVWQRYVSGDQYSDVYYSIYNPTTGATLKNRVRLEQQVKYYTYDVQYLPQIDRFLIVGAYYTGGGFGILLDTQGNIIKKITNLPALVREAQGISKAIGSETKVVYACQPSGVMVLAATATDLVYRRTIADSYRWYGIGTDGIFLTNNKVYMTSLSPCGLITRLISL